MIMHTVRKSRRNVRLVPCTEWLESRVALSGGLDPSFGSGDRVTLGGRGGGGGGGGGGAGAPGGGGRGARPAGRPPPPRPPPPPAALGEGAVIARLNTDGSLDTTFGQGGKVILPSPDPRERLAKITAMAVQPDGSIIVVGATERSIPSTGAVPGVLYPEQDFWTAKLNADGSLDTSFGTVGQVLVPFNIGGDDDDTANGVALQPDGKIVVFGTAEAGINNSMAAVARLNPDGSLDSSFANGGRFTLSFGYRNTHASAAVGGAIQPDGKIVIFGSASSAPLSTAMAAARLNSNGSIDTSFGSSRSRRSAGPTRFDCTGPHASTGRSSRPRNTCPHAE